jgi:butyryl-CoA dehydrogenase
METDDSHARNSGLLAAMRYFHVYELPKIDAWLAVVAARESVCREMQATWF